MEASAWSNECSWTSSWRYATTSVPEQRGHQYRGGCAGWLSAARRPAGGSYQRCAPRADPGASAVQRSSDGPGDRTASTPNGFAANAGLGGVVDTPDGCVAVQRNLETLEKRADRDFTKLNRGCKAPFLGRNNLRALTGWKVAWQEKTSGSCRDAEHEPTKKVTSVLGCAGKAEGRDPSPQPARTKLQLEGRAQCWTAPYGADLAQDWSKPKEEPKG